MGFLTAILGLVFIGMVIAAIVLNWDWLKEKVNEWLDEKPGGEVALGELEKMAKKCKNKMSRDEFNTISELEDEGCTHLLWKISKKGNVKDVEALKDISDVADAKIERLLDRDEDGLLIIEG